MAQSEALFPAGSTALTQNVSKTPLLNLAGGFQLNHQSVPFAFKSLVYGKR